MLGKKDIQNVKIKKGKIIKEENVQKKLILNIEKCRLTYIIYNLRLEK